MQQSGEDFKLGFDEAFVVLRDLTTLQDIYFIQNRTKLSFVNKLTFLCNYFILYSYLNVLERFLVLIQETQQN